MFLISTRTYTVKFEWVNKKTTYGFRLQLFVGKHIVGSVCLNSCAKGDKAKTYVGQCGLPGMQGKDYNGNIQALQNLIEERAKRWFAECSVQA